MICVKELDFSYGERKVLSDISFFAEEGSLLCVLGPNGVGKSTLFRCILGLLPFARGEVTVDGMEVKKMSARVRAEKLAYIPQATRSTFDYSVLDMVLMGTSARLSPFKNPGKKEEEQALQALERLHVEHLSHRSFGQISGGEQQLVLIARALAQGARTLIMDEPTSSLDYGNQIRAQEQLRMLADEGYTILQSIHNPEQAYMFADKVLNLVDGGVYSFGAPREVITAGLLKKLYGIDVTAKSLFEDRARVFIPSAVLK